jgi:epoxyqueuosine reductase
VLTAIGNSGDVTLAKEAERLLDDESPLVRGAAVWAISRLAPERITEIQSRRTPEIDASVIEEWRAANSASPSPP